MNFNHSTLFIIHTEASVRRELTALLSEDPSLSIGQVMPLHSKEQAAELMESGLMPQLILLPYDHQDRSSMDFVRLMNLEKQEENPAVIWITEKKLPNKEQHLLKGLGHEVLDFPKDKAELGRIVRQSLYSLQSRGKDFGEENKEEKKLYDSIRYAARIQKAIMPNFKQIEDYLQDFFLYYSPKDIVSGDFYWFSKKRTGRYDYKIVLVAADCTGHGIPGALMSMLSATLLDRYVNYLNITSPELLLFELHNGITRTLKQHSTDNQDGLDASVAVIDTKTGTLEFSGARNGLIYVDEEGVGRIKGDPYSIGGTRQDQPIEFTKHTLDLSEQDMPVYMYSDGFQDQFGGPENRKIGRRRMMSLIEDVHDLPASLQKEAVAQAFESWKAGYKQIDDVMLMGFNARLRQEQLLPNKSHQVKAKAAQGIKGSAA